MAQLSLNLLGSLAAVYEQRPLTHFRTKAVQALLIYLVCQPEVHAREALLTLLWPELPTKSAQANLRHALYHLRQIIPTVDNGSGGKVPFVLADRQTIQVNPDGRFHLDITQFEALTQSQKMEDGETAVTLYRADFLSDFYLPDSPAFESWAQRRRAALRRRLLDTLVNLTNHHLDEGNFEQAEQYARQQLAIDNLREEAHRQLMMVLAQNGRRIDALTHYQGLYQLLQDELGITPSTATEALVEAIRSDSLGREMEDSEIEGEGREVRVEVSRPVPHNLPTQTTPFIGRQTELVALDDLLANSQTRLVTILGAGGMGKTRLSLAAAEHQLARQQFVQGVFFVPLAGLGESDRIVSAIAEAMDIQLEKGETQLLNYLRAKQILLVLDNFEHLLDGSELVSRLLQAAPQLQILVTSRERLRLQGEQVYPLQGLVVDDTAVNDDARSLFLQAARRLRPDFAVTADNLPTLKHLCGLVEGMPLALELAAAWVDLFTLEEIVAEIQRNLDFLESDLRDVPSRHRSMQAVYNTSWQQLSANEKQLLVQVTIFKGGFSREAVMAVTKASLRDLAALVNKSLLTFDLEIGRYHLHELFRQFGAEVLVADPNQEKEMRQLHSAYYCAFVQKRGEALKGPESMKAEAEITADIENVRKAWNWAIENDESLLFQAQTGLDHYYERQGRWLEMENAFLRAEARVADWNQANARHIAEFLALASDAVWTRSQAIAESFVSRAITYLSEAANRGEDIRAEEALVLRMKHQISKESPEVRRKLLEKSLSLYQELEMEWEMIWVHNELGWSYARQSNYQVAHELFRQAVNLAETVGDQRTITWTKFWLADMKTWMGLLDKAETKLDEAITLSESNHDEWGSMYGQMKFCTMLILSGRFEETLPILLQCRAVAASKNVDFWVRSSHTKQGWAMLHLGQYYEARQEFQFAATLNRESNETDTYSSGLTSFYYGSIALALGRLNEAQANFQESARIFRTIHQSDEERWAHAGLGYVAMYTGDFDTAENHLVKALNPAFFMPTLLALPATALLLAHRGQAEKAIELYNLALQYPFIANSRWFADVIGKRIMAASANLSKDEIITAQTRGKEMDMWQTAELLLNQDL